MTESGREQQDGGEQEQPAATSSAKRKAEEMGVDLSEMESPGAQGRITVMAVVNTANQQ